MFDVPGLHIVAIQNRISKLQTAIKNLKSLTGGISKFREFKETVFNEFQPDVVITDFEPTTAYMANHRDLPLISIDNQHRMRYMEYPCPGDSQERRARHRDGDSRLCAQAGYLTHHDVLLWRGEK